MFLISIFGYSQEIDKDSTDNYNKYREDQFYISLTYNLLANKPEGLSQSGFSSGSHIGFIRDFPINSKRTVALGLGLGYNLNSFNQNMLINKTDEGETEFIILDNTEINYIRNRFTTHLLEVPFELRWRDSDSKKYDFWRLYLGFKVGYVFAHGTKFKGDLGTVKFTDIQEFNDFQYGLTLSFGYNKWNAHMYYALNPIFDNSAEIGSESLDVRMVKFGLIFYIL